MQLHQWNLISRESVLHGIRVTGFLCCSRVGWSGYQTLFNSVCCSGYGNSNYDCECNEGVVILCPGHQNQDLDHWQEKVSAVKRLPRLILLHLPWNILYAFRPFCLSGLDDVSRHSGPQCCPPHQGFECSGISFLFGNSLHWYHHSSHVHTSQLRTQSTSFDSPAINQCCIG